MSWVLRGSSNDDQPGVAPFYSIHSPYFSIRMHHSGVFDGNAEKVYKGGRISHFDNVESDLLSLVELNNMAKELGLLGLKRFYCKTELKGWHSLDNDADVVDLGKQIGKHRLVNIYVEDIDGATPCNKAIGRRQIDLILACSEEDENDEMGEELGDDAIQGDSMYDFVDDPEYTADDNVLYAAAQLFRSNSCVDGAGPSRADKVQQNEYCRPEHETEQEAQADNVQQNDFSTHELESEPSRGDDVQQNDHSTHEHRTEHEALAGGANEVHDILHDVNVCSDNAEIASDSDISVDVEKEYHSDSAEQSSSRMRKGMPKYQKFNPMIDMADPKFFPGLEFADRWVFKEAVIEHSIKLGKQVKWVKSDTRRARAKCRDDCEFIVLASRKGTENTFQVKTFKDHTCNRSFDVPLLSTKWLTEKYCHRIRTNPNYPVKSLKADVMHEHLVNSNIGMLYRVRSNCLKRTIGSETEQYKALWSYCAEIYRAIPDSTCLIKARPVDENSAKFERIYICPGALKKGFKECCRPFIGLDGCHLKGPTGVLLTAVGVDPNNQMYPFAYAVVEKEMYKSWKWFLENIKDDLEIENDFHYTFMSDKQKGLQQAISQLFPNSEHRHCLRHLYNNFRLQHRGLALKSLLEQAARATRECDFKRTMDMMKAMDEKAHEWLTSRPAKHWSRAFFRTDVKCDVLLNNYCESFNGVGKIMDARAMPILTMLEEIRLYLMERLHMQRDAMKRYNGIICPTIQKTIEDLKKNAAAFIPRWNGDWKFEVTSGTSSRMVDLQVRTCSCRKWDLTGIPCCHAISACNMLRIEPESLVDDCYKKDTFMKLYSNLLNTINDRDIWPEAGVNELLPPDVTNMPGRPKKLRRKEPHEIVIVNGSLRRKGTINRCKYCHGEGHNKRGCKKYKERVVAIAAQEAAQAAGNDSEQAAAQEAPKNILHAENRAPEIADPVMAIDENAAQGPTQQSMIDGTAQPPILEDDFIDDLVITQIEAIEEMVNQGSSVAANQPSRSENISIVLNNEKGQASKDCADGIISAISHGNIQYLSRSSEQHSMINNSAAPPFGILPPNASQVVSEVSNQPVAIGNSFVQPSPFLWRGHSCTTLGALKNATTVPDCTKKAIRARKSAEKSREKKSGESSKSGTKKMS